MVFLGRTTTQPLSVYWVQVLTPPLNSMGGYAAGQAGQSASSTFLSIVFGSGIGVRLMTIQKDSSKVFFFYLMTKKGIFPLTFWREYDKNLGS